MWSAQDNLGKEGRMPEKLENERSWGLQRLEANKGREVLIDGAVDA